MIPQMTGLCFNWIVSTEMEKGWCSLTSKFDGWRNCYCELANVWGSSCILPPSVSHENVTSNWCSVMCNHLHKWNTDYTGDLRIKCRFVRDTCFVCLFGLFVLYGKKGEKKRRNMQPTRKRIDFFPNVDFFSV